MIELYHPTVKSRPLETKLNKEDIEKLVLTEYTRKAKAIGKER